MNTGDSFAAIAKDLSDDSATKEKGGDIGWLNPEDLDPRLQETVKGLPVGEVSDPLQTAQGIELLRIAERDSARVHLEHIRVNLPVSEAGKERAKRGADEVRGLALKGADFGQLAKEYSDDGESKEKGGNLGFFNSAELAPNIGQAVQGLAVGEISEVVGSDVGYHVFKVLAREGGGEWTFDEVKDRVMNVMQEERAQSMTDNWLAGVRAKYFIRRTDQPVGAAAVPAGTVPPAAVPAAAPADTPVAEPVRP